VREIRLPNALLPIDGEDLKRLFRESGLTITERSSDERELMAFLRRHIKPDLERTAYLRDALSEVLDFWKRTFGGDSVRDQPAIIGMLRESLKEGGVVIYSYRDVDITETRVNSAGLVMREILRLSKREPADRLVVLEEAHNFAPERGTAEVQTGRENLSFAATKRIATEGRKLRIGLVAVTQRPANISKFILSQLNTQVVFKLLTRNDLEAVSPFFEQSKEDIFRLLPFLKPGTAYAGGLAFSFLFQMEEIPYW